jgi:hypothetical protein
MLKYDNYKGFSDGKSGYNRSEDFKVFAAGC